MKNIHSLLHIFSLKEILDRGRTKYLMTPPNTIILIIPIKIWWISFYTSKNHACERKKINVCFCNVIHWLIIFRPLPGRMLRYQIHVFTPRFDFSYSIQHPRWRPITFLSCPWMRIKANQCKTETVWVTHLHITLRHSLYIFFLFLPYLLVGESLDDQSDNKSL